MRRKIIMTNNDKKKKKNRAAAADRRNNSLTAENAREEVAHMLLVKALKQEFEAVDRLQGGSFIHGSMGRLSADMWKEVIK
jgi:hypothetical protein